MHGSLLMMCQALHAWNLHGDSAYHGYNFDTWSQNWNLLVVKEVKWFRSCTMSICLHLSHSSCFLAYTGIQWDQLQSRMHITYTVIMQCKRWIMLMLSFVHHCMIKALSEKWQPSLVSAHAQLGHSSVELWLRVLSDSLGRMPWHHCIVTVHFYDASQWLI